jgi:hypothetical protein
MVLLLGYWTGVDWVKSWNERMVNQREEERKKVRTSGKQFFMHGGL